MIPVTSRSSQHLAVFGLGGSGRATAHALMAGGATVTAWDDNEASRAEAANENIPLADLTACDWSGFSALILSPGIPLTHPAPHPVVECARSAGRPVIGDIELLAENSDGAVLIGITGTNGKSTTSALIHHVLQTADIPVQIGGNFGPPVLGLDPAGEQDTIVLELSSYQLDLTQSATFDIAVLLNITPDHLDRHGDMTGYVAAKKRIFRASGRDGGQIAVVGIDDPYGNAIYEELSGNPAWRVVPVSVGTRLDNGVWVEDGIIHDDAGNTCSIIHIDTLRGRHNWQNAAVTWAIGRARGLSPDQIATGFESYPGLPHRLETVAEIDGVRYVNDSKATNGEAAARALSSFDDIYWIAGGVAKEDGLAPTEPYLKHVRRAFLIGESAADFEAMLDGKIPVTQSGNLETAVRDARHHATADGLPTPVILLSPACASFDQYANFTLRGDHFRELANAVGNGGTA